MNNLVFCQICISKPGKHIRYSGRMDLLGTSTAGEPRRNEARACSRSRCERSPWIEVAATCDGGWGELRLLLVLETLSILEASVASGRRGSKWPPPAIGRGTFQLLQKSICGTGCDLFGGLPMSIWGSVYFGGCLRSVEELLQLLGRALRLDKDDRPAGVGGDELEQLPPLVVLFAEVDVLRDEGGGGADAPDRNEDVARHELGCELRMGGGGV